jgi:hypothetical protein
MIFSQSTTILKKGADFTIEHKAQFQGVIGVNKNAMFSVQSQFNGDRLKDLFLGKYSTDSLYPKMVKSIFPKETATDVYQPKEIFMLDTAIFLCCSKENKKTNEVQLVLFPISAQGILGNEHNFGRLNITDKEHDAYELATGEDEKSFVIFRYLPYNNGEKQLIECTGIHTDLSEYWKDTLVFPYVNFSFYFSQIWYDGQYRLYFKGRKTNGIDAPTSSTASVDNNSCFLFSYNGQSKQLKEIELKIDHLHIQSLDFLVNDSVLYLAGFVSSLMSSGTTGLFSMVLNKDFEITQTALHSFTPEELSAFYPNKQPESSIDQLQSKGMLLAKDGHFCLLGEQFYKETYTNYDMRMNVSSLSSIYNYNSVLLSLFDANGNWLKNESIPKFQSTLNDGGYYSSFYATVEKEAFVLFFNDNQRNQHLGNSDVRDMREMKSYTNTYICKASIKFDGTSTREEINSELKNKLLVPQLAYKLPNNQSYLYLEKGKQAQFILFGF